MNSKYLALTCIMGGLLLSACSATPRPTTTGTDFSPTSEETSIPSSITSEESSITSSSISEDTSESSSVVSSETQPSSSSTSSEEPLVTYTASIAKATETNPGGTIVNTFYFNKQNRAEILSLIVDSLPSNDSLHTYAWKTPLPDELPLADVLYVFVETTIKYSVNLSINGAPNSVASVSGGGTYSVGETVTASVSLSSGAPYIFRGWALNGSIVSTDKNYSFAVSKTTFLVATFYTFTNKSSSLNVKINNYKIGDTSVSFMVEPKESTSSTLGVAKSISVLSATSNTVPHTYSISDDLKTAIATINLSEINSNLSFGGETEPISIVEFGHNLSSELAEVSGSGAYYNGDNVVGEASLTEEGTMKKLSARSFEGYLLQNWTRDNKQVGTHKQKLVALKAGSVSGKTIANFRKYAIEFSHASSSGYSNPWGTLACTYEAGNENLTFDVTLPYAGRSVNVEVIIYKNGTGNKLSDAITYREDYTSGYKYNSHAYISIPVSTLLDGAISVNIHTL